MESGGLKPKPAKSEAKLQSIWIKVSLIDWPVWLIVSLRLLANSLAVCWLAITPAGIDIMIAIAKPNAMITSDARIFRREIFRSALFRIPKFMYTY